MYVNKYIDKIYVFLKAESILYIYNIYIYIKYMYFWKQKESENAHRKRVSGQCLELLHTEKSFRNLIKSILNQIVFTIHRLIWISKRTLSAWIQINRLMVNTIWFQVVFNKSREIFVCVQQRCLLYQVANNGHCVGVQWANCFAIYLIGRGELLPRNVASQASRDPFEGPLNLPLEYRVYDTDVSVGDTQSGPYCTERS